MSSENPKAQNLLILALTVVVALILDIMPLPDVLAFLRPEWTFLVVIFWTLAMPYRIGIGVAWFTGLALDLLEAHLLGLQALSMAMASYLCLILYQRVRLYPVYQQSLVIFLIIGLHLSLVHWVQGRLGVVSDGYSFLIPALASAIIWPFVFLVLLAVKRRFRVQ